MFRRRILPALFAIVSLLVGALGAPQTAAANPAAEWRLDFIIISVDPDAELELFNPQGEPGDRLVERVKGVVFNGLLDATDGFFHGTRPVVLLAVVRRFDGLSTGATLFAGGEMRATIDVWFADSRTTEELTPVRTLEVARVTLGSIGGLFAHFIGGSQTTRFSRSIANRAREWLAGLDTLAALGPDHPVAELAPGAAPELPDGSGPPLPAIAESVAGEMTIANARWAGLSPAAFSGGTAGGAAGGASDERWVAGPFDVDEREGWVTDVATGATVRVRFVRRDPDAGTTRAELSRAAAEALGVAPDQTVDLAVYLPR